MSKLRVIALAAGILLVLAACGGAADTPAQNATGNQDSAAAPAGAVAAQEGTPTAMTGISVSGRGEVVGTPDTLTVTIGVSVTRSSVGEAVDVAAERATGLIEALTGLGVAEEDVQTSNYSIYPEYDYSNDRAPRITGYRVDNTLNVKIRDLDRAGAILDAVTGSVGDEVEVSGLSFSIEDNDGLVAAARADAWADAEAKAQQLAGLAGVELGAPVAIVESVNPSPPVVPFAAFDVAQEAAATPIESGQLAVTVTINVQYSIAG